jgi:uncharacterized OsmC-like protein
VSSGDLRPPSHGGIEFGHQWTPDGVVVQSDFTGAHLLHLSIAGCVLNDVHREAERVGVPVDGVKVAAWGDINRDTWQSTGVNYSVEVSSPASPAEIDELLRIVDDVAEIPKALRSEAAVDRT